MFLIFTAGLLYKSIGRWWRDFKTEHMHADILETASTAPADVHNAINQT